MCLSPGYSALDGWARCRPDASACCATTPGGADCSLWTASRVGVDSAYQLILRAATPNLRSASFQAVRQQLKKLWMGERRRL